MTADTITAIKKALEGVTVQEWTFDGPADSIIIWCGTDTRVCFMTSDGPAKAHARFITACQPAAISELLSTLESLQRENAELRKKLAGCDWYWPEDDTSSDACADSVWSIAEAYDLKPADVLAYSRGGVVETRYFAFLPPADDSDSDDNFEVDEPTEEAVSAKITSEIERRTALASTGGEHHGN